MKRFILTLLLAATPVFAQSSIQSVYITLGVNGVTYEGGNAKSNYLVKTGINGKLSAAVIPLEALAGNTSPFSVAYVDAKAPVGGNGSLSVPYNDLNTAIAHKGTNSVIMVRPGNYGVVTCLTAVVNLRIVNTEGLAGPTSTGSVIISSLVIQSPTLARNLVLSGVKAGTVSSVSNSKLYVQNGSDVTMAGTGSLTDLYKDSTSTVSGFTGVKYLAQADAIEYSGGVTIKAAIDSILNTNIVIMPANTPTNAILIKGTNGWGYITPGTNTQILKTGSNGVPVWVDNTNNVQTGDPVHGQILGWSTNQGRYASVTVPEGGWYALSNSISGLAVNRIPLRPGLAQYDIAMWDGYNWVPLPKGPTGSYLASTAGGVGYVKFPVTQGLADGDLLCWNAATTNFRLIANNAGYTNRVLMGGTNPTFRVLASYGSFDPRLPSSEYMSNVSTGSMLRWDPANFAWSIIAGYNGTASNVFLRGGATPAFAAIPSIEAQGGVTAAAFGVSTQNIWQSMLNTSQLADEEAARIAGDIADREYALALVEAMESADNPATLRLMDRANAMAWLEYTNGMLQQVIVTNVFHTEYQWKGYSTLALYVTAGITYNGDTHPSDGITIWGAYQTNSIAGATAAILLPDVTGFYPLAAAVDGTTVGLAAQGGKVTPVYRKERPSTHAMYYTHPGIQYATFSAYAAPEGAFSSPTRTAGILEDLEESSAFPGPFAGTCGEAAGGGATMYTGGAEGAVIHLFRVDTLIATPITNRTDLLAFTNGLWQVISTKANTADVALAIAAGATSGSNYTDAVVGALNINATRLDDAQGITTQWVEYMSNKLWQVSVLIDVPISYQWYVVFPSEGLEVTANGGPEYASIGLGIYVAPGAVSTNIVVGLTNS